MLGCDRSKLVCVCDNLVTSTDVDGMSLDQAMATY